MRTLEQNEIEYISGGSKWSEAAWYGLEGAGLGAGAGSQICGPVCAGIGAVFGAAAGAYHGYEDER